VVGGLGFVGGLGGVRRGGFDAVVGGFVGGFVGGCGGVGAVWASASSFVSVSACGDIFYGFVLEDHWDSRGRPEFMWASYRLVSMWRLWLHGQLKVAARWGLNNQAVQMQI
jgi:hypothetical protein